ncbi:hypothetical protein CBL_08168 [Carabus blaptoides fortunei]
MKLGIVPIVKGGAPNSLGSGLRLSDFSFALDTGSLVRLPYLIRRQIEVASSALGGKRYCPRVQSSVILATGRPEIGVHSGRWQLKHESEKRMSLTTRDEIMNAPVLFLRFMFDALSFLITQRSSSVACGTRLATTQLSARDMELLSRTLWKRRISNNQRRMKPS